MKWAIAKFAWSKTWPALLLAIVAVVGGSWWHGYATGKTAERTMHQLRLIAAQEDARMAQERLADELERAQAERRIVYRDRIRYVDRVVDDCADVPVPDGVLDALRSRDDG